MHHGPRELNDLDLFILPLLQAREEDLPLRGFETIHCGWDRTHNGGHRVDDHLLLKKVSKRHRSFRVIDRGRRHVVFVDLFVCCVIMIVRAKERRKRAREGEGRWLVVRERERGEEKEKEKE